MAARPVFVRKADREKHKIEDKLKFSQDALSKSSQVSEIASKDTQPVITAGRKRNHEEPRESKEDRQRRAELREQYLDSGRPKKRIPKPSDNRKFKFDWDSTEDTSKNIAPLHHLDRPLFSRGFIAGVDRPEKASKSSSGRESQIFNENHGISLKFMSKSASSSSPRTIRSWEESGICEKLRRSIKAAGFKSPTPIQMAAIPFGFAGYNIVGIAGTGTGKTAAFLIPILDNLIQEREKNPHAVLIGQGPKALILAPTRDLALQIEHDARNLGGKMVMISIAVGGRSIDSQSRDAADCDLMIATPGRLLDLMDQRFTCLERVEVVVIDEADRMMEEMAEDLVKVLEEAAGRTQTLMFSATMAPPMEKIARCHMMPGGASTITITVSAVSNTVNASTISQHFFFLRGGSSEKPAKLREVASLNGSGIIFVNEKIAVNDVRNILRKAGYAAIGMNGEMRQSEREASLDGFRHGEYRFLVATDLVSRGIDVAGVECVINYDSPWSLDTYLHRIGRTGRAGKHGNAITFLTPKDSEMFPKLRKHLEENKIKVPHELMDRRDS